MNDLKVSIIIPHRDQPEQLRSCLDRLMNLGYDAAEILVVDNHSRNSLDFLRNYPVKLLHSDSKPSPYIARNTGIRHSTGKIIILLDVNAVVQPGWLENALELLKEDVIIGGIPVRPHPDDLDVFQRFDYLYAVIYPAESNYESLKALPATNLFFYKSTWEKVGPFPEVRSLGDMAWTNRARKKGYTLIVDPAIRFSYPFKSQRTFTAKFRRLGGGKVENGFVRYPVWYIIKNFLPPSPRFIRRMQSKNKREEMHLSLVQLFWLCYWVKINYGVGAMKAIVNLF